MDWLASRRSHVLPPSDERKSASLGGFNERVHNFRIRWRDGDGNASPRLRRKSFGALFVEIRPGCTAIGGHEKTAAAGSRRRSRRRTETSNPCAENPTCPRKEFSNRPSSWKSSSSPWTHSSLSGFWSTSCRHRWFCKRRDRRCRSTVFPARRHRRCSHPWDQSEFWKFAPYPSGPGWSSCRRRRWICRHRCQSKRCCASTARRCPPRWFSGSEGSMAMAPDGLHVLLVKHGLVRRAAVHGFPHAAACRGDIDSQPAVFFNRRERIHAPAHFRGADIARAEA